MIFQYSIYKLQSILATDLKQIIVFEYFLHIYFITYSFFIILGYQVL